MAMRGLLLLNVLVMNDPIVGLRGGFCTVNYLIGGRIYKLAGLLLARI
jgi:hypothetical protein